MIIIANQSRERKQAERLPIASNSLLAGRVPLIGTHIDGIAAYAPL